MLWIAVVVVAVAESPELDFDAFEKGGAAQFSRTELEIIDLKLGSESSLAFPAATLGIGLVLAPSMTVASFYMYENFNDLRAGASGFWDALIVGVGGIAFGVTAVLAAWGYVFGIGGIAWLGAVDSHNERLRKQRAKVRAAIARREAAGETADARRLAGVERELLDGRRRGLGAPITCMAVGAALIGVGALSISLVASRPDGNRAFIAGGVGEAGVGTLLLIVGISQLAVRLREDFALDARELELDRLRGPARPPEMSRLIPDRLPPAPVVVGWTWAI